MPGRVEGREDQDRQRDPITRFRDRDVDGCVQASRGGSDDEGEHDGRHGPGAACAPEGGPAGDEEQDEQEWVQHGVGDVRERAESHGAQRACERGEVRRGGGCGAWT